MAYLEKRLPALTNPYAVAMTSYALAQENKLNREILYNFISPGVVTQKHSSCYSEMVHGCKDSKSVINYYNGFLRADHHIGTIYIMRRFSLRTKKPKICLIYLLNKVSLRFSTRTGSAISQPVQLPITFVQLNLGDIYQKMIVYVNVMLKHVFFFLNLPQMAVQG